MLLELFFYRVVPLPAQRPHQRLPYLEREGTACYGKRFKMEQRPRHFLPSSFLMRVDGDAWWRWWHGSIEPRQRQGCPMVVLWTTKSVGKVLLEVLVLLQCSDCDGRRQIDMREGNSLVARVCSCG
jgi:hypothetical protein